MRCVCCPRPFVVLKCSTSLTCGTELCNKISWSSDSRTHVPGWPSTPLLQSSSSSQKRQLIETNQQEVRMTNCSNWNGIKHQRQQHKMHVTTERIFNFTFFSNLLKRFTIYKPKSPNTLPPQGPLSTCPNKWLVYASPFVQCLLPPAISTCGLSSTHLHSWWKCCASVTVVLRPSGCFFKTSTPPPTRSKVTPPDPPSTCSAPATGKPLVVRESPNQKCMTNSHTHTRTTQSAP